MLKDKEIKEKEPIQKIWHSKLDLETQIPVLDFKYQGKVVRKLPFYEHLGRKNESATILKIGACNFNCPYCFRYSQSEPHQTLPLWKLLKIGMDAINQDMIIRLSGGDPVATSKESVEMVKFFYQQKGEKFSHGRVAVAHNGSSPSFVKKIAPYLEMIALDVKTVPEKYCWRSGCQCGQADDLGADDPAAAQTDGTGRVQLLAALPVLRHLSCLFLSGLV